MVLRNAPYTDDKYDSSGASEFIGHAVFGNILRKYLYGVKGKVVSRYIDKNKDKWLFVIIDSSNDRLSYQTPYKVNVGWVKERNEPIAKE